VPTLAPVAVMVTVYVPAGVPVTGVGVGGGGGGPPALPPPPQPTKTTAIMIPARPNASFSFVRLRRHVFKVNTAKTKSKIICSSRNMPSPRGRTHVLTVVPRATVDIFIVIEVVDASAGVICGLKLHEAPAGSPLQPNVTAPVDDVVRTWNVKAADCPAVTVAVVVPTPVSRTAPKTGNGIVAVLLFELPSPPPVKVAVIGS
jgi:hypothetical protein